MIRIPRFEKALQAKRESKYVDFKASFDPNSQREWLEIIKDIVAMANTGGGYILFGVKNDGSIEKSWNPDIVLQIDPATVTDKLNSYTSIQFAEFEILDGARGRKTIAVMKILEASPPMIFTRQGAAQREYDPRRQHVVFNKGTLYFRHGAKSEPGAPKDLLDFEHRLLERHRRHLTQNLRKVAEAPTGAVIRVLKPGSTIDDDGKSVRIVTDSTVATGVLSTDKKYPNRQSDLVRKLNTRLAPDRKITSYDIMCARRVYKIDDDPNLFYSPKFSSPQYSEQWLTWLISQVEADPQFFQKIRSTAKSTGLV